MSTYRRVIVVFTSFLVLMGAIAGQLVNFSLLGQYGNAFHGRFSLMVLTIGVSLQIIFLGPSRLETLRSLTYQREGQVPIDEAYLRFEMRRAARLFAVILPMAFLSIFTDLFSTRLVYGALIFLIALSAFILARILILRYRVNKKLYGNNEYEARELLRFLEKLWSKEINHTMTPPGNMEIKHETVEEAVTIPTAATLVT